MNRAVGVRRAASRLRPSRTGEQWEATDAEGGTMARITDEQARLLLDANYGVVTTLRKDGSPHMTTVWLDWDGESVVFNTAEGRAKPRNLRRDPRAGIHVLDPRDPYRWLAVSGPAEMTTDGADEHIDKLAKKYLGRDKYP